MLKPSKCSIVHRCRDDDMLLHHIVLHGFGDTSLQTLPFTCSIACQQRPNVYRKNRSPHDSNDASTASIIGH